MVGVPQHVVAHSLRGHAPKFRSKYARLPSSETLSDLVIPRPTAAGLREESPTIMRMTTILQDVSQSIRPQKEKHRRNDKRTAFCLIAPECSHKHSLMHARMHARMHVCTHARTHAHTHPRTHEPTHQHTHATSHPRTHSHWTFTDSRRRTHARRPKDSGITKYDEELPISMPTSFR